MSRYKQPYCLYKRGKYWYYKTYALDGSRTCGKTTHCTSKNSARIYCDKLFLTGSLVTSSKKFADYAAGFFDSDSVYLSDRNKPLSKNTLLSYRQLLKNRVLPYFEKMDLSEITHSKIKAWRASLLADGLAVNTIQVCVLVLNIIFKSAVNDNLISSNPAENLPALQKDSVRDSFTREEVRAVFRSAGVNSAFVLLLALTGMRFSELYGVTENDIVQIDGVDFVYLQQQKDKDGEYIPLKTKTARYIPLSPRLVPFVRSMNTKNAQSAIRNSLRPVFASLENAKERKLSCHSFRHFFITDAKAQNINPQKVEVIAGHTLSGIEKTYTNFKPSDLIDIIGWQNEMLDYLNSAI